MRIHPILLNAPLAFLLGSSALAQPQQAAPLQTVQHPATEVAGWSDEDFLRELKKLLLQMQIGKAQRTEQELWGWLDGLQARYKKAHGSRQEIEYLLPYDDLAEALLVSGKENTYQRLLTIYHELPPASYAHQILLRPLSQVWRQRALAELGKVGPPAVKLPPYAGPLPQNLQAASPELQNAWRRYKAFDEAFKAAVAERKEPALLDVQQGWPLFYEIAGEILGGKVAGQVPRLAQFHWSGWCGTGRESLTDPQSHLFFMTLLEERRLAPAIGALFETMNNGLWNYDLNESWQRDFIALCGEDWEVLFAGAALEGKTTLRHLARFGSSQAARLLLQMAQVPKISAQDDYAFAIAAFIKSSGLASDYGVGSSRDTPRAAKEAIPDEIQQQLLQVLHDQVRPGAGRESIESLSHILVRLARPESKAVFHRIMEMPYGKARERAALALRALGETVALRPTRAVAFRLLANGKAVPSTTIEWEMRAGEFGVVSSGLETGAGGSFQLERDYLVDAARKVTQLRFAAKELVTPRDLWFEVQSAPPADLETTTEVKVETGALTLDLQPNHPADFYADKPILLRLKAERPLATTSYFAPVSKDLSLSFASQITFPALQKRKYRVEIFAPGAARLEQEIVLDSDNKTVPLALQPGAALRFEIVAPGGDRRDPAPEYILLREGKAILPYLHYDSATRLYRGLPPGAYKLKVLSSAEKQTKNAGRRGAHEISPPLQFPAYSGTQCEFVIDQNAPAVVDLGDIKLLPG